MWSPSDAPTGAERPFPRWGPPLLLTAIWTLLIVVANPVGDFPINDDWAYGASVRDLIAGRGFHFPSWSAASLVTNVLWGALFCVFGFSFTALRASTLTLGLVGILGTYGAARELGASKAHAFLLALTLLATPLYFGLSNSFLSDVPFVAELVIGLWLFSRGMRTGSAAMFAGAIFIAVWAVLTRQAALAMPVVFGLAALGQRTDRKRNLAWAFGALVLVFGALRLFERWLKASGQMPPVYGKQTKELAAAFAERGASVAFDLITRNGTVVYVGFFALPMVLLVAWELGRSAGRKQQVLAAVVALGYAHRVVHDLRGRVFPLFGNCLVNFGWGPVTLADVIYSGAKPPQAPYALLRAVTWVGVVGVGLLVFVLVLAVLRLLWRRAEIASPALLTMALGFAALYWLAMPLFYWDRYLVLFVPLIALICASIKLPRITWLPAAASVAVIALQLWFSLAAVRDYLTWNRARWRALDDLTKQRGISPDEIDGGFEFGGLHRYPKPPSPGKSTWWVKDDRYLVALTERPGYRVAARYPFSRWLTPSRPGAILTLERIEPPVTK